MPLQAQILQVFVASPTDVQPERDALEEVVRELNKTIGGPLAIRLELIRWETDSYPSLGSDPQAVLSEQLPSDFDIFLGILWQRFGTQTPRAASGTQEEFEQAHQRFISDPDSVAVMFYFKKAPVDPFNVDLSQLELVRQFRDSLKREGIVGTFETLDEFRSHVRIHLTRLLNAWSSSGKLGNRAFAEMGREEADGRTPEQSVEEEDEEGFLDLIERTEESMAAATDVATRLAAQIERLGDSAKEVGRELRDLGEADTTDKRKAAKRLLNQMAERMTHFATAIRSETPILGDSFGRGVRALQDASLLIGDFQGDPTEVLESSLENLRSLRETLASTGNSMANLRQTISGQPRLTTRFNKAKRSAVVALDALGKELSAEQQLLREAELLLEGLIERA